MILDTVASRRLIQLYFLSVNKSKVMIEQMDLLNDNVLNYKKEIEYKTCWFLYSITYGIIKN
ncbi:hypothetical protein NC797_11530 [Aquibacillus sp. 3ASR75-11]|uniref:Uncharacterized protein n=1 Tax=Terrihalobacillus insolitus TaxID=2950438 RepID=A0A9X3WVT9_9BACI|nr:hypothetical protein [Terrihalobacillus insolitus]MDC3425136.1 hypothetical protein [Terrihalobacillus insolitus]